MTIVMTLPAPVAAQSASCRSSPSSAYGVGNLAYHWRLGRPFVSGFDSRHVGDLRLTMEQAIAMPRRFPALEGGLVDTPFGGSVSTESRSFRLDPETRQEKLMIALSSYSTRMKVRWDGRTRRSRVVMFNTQPVSLSRTYGMSVYLPDWESNE